MYYNIIYINIFSWGIFMKKEKKDELFFEKPIDFINKYYKLFIACGSALCIVVLYILRFFEYITASYYFSYYGLNIGLYKYNDQGFIYSLCVSVIILIAFTSIILSSNDLVKKLKYNVNKKIISELLLLIFYNFVLSFVFFKFVNWYSFTIYNIALLLIELLLSFFFFRNDDTLGKDEAKDKLKKYIKSFPFFIIILLMLYGGRIFSKINLIKNYNLIGNDKVVIYTNNDYYITLDCEIVDDNLIIYKGKQTKIDNKDVYTVSKTFEKVELNSYKES